ncbi:UDP-galactose phosphate transferase [Roseivirga sp. 4D4]|uniref:sugar transferase n=1 Tax=Roseivirga sp. 4D4 TaxID=1889784 RepID=UPI000852CC1F|nr:sugar transferase [Roseivirga sp. 4D4]OEK01620.1 UDP-galactose phosphate transferase [Roseivirga sp. 4D4]
MYRSFFKRLIDLILAIILMFISFPFFIIVVILLSFANSGKPFFFQKRPGKFGEVFTIAKLKTMNDKRGKDGELLPDADRLTGLGKIIRKLSLDELPQLLNVIKGDMSFVGPRPLLVEYLPLYSEEQSRRHSVRPGITGWAQVNGRNTISWEKKFEYDVWYVDHLSFGLDLKILLLTFLKVFRTKEISSATSATMEKFTGNRR